MTLSRPLVAVAIILLPLALFANSPQYDADLTKKMEKVIREVEQIKVGMTRAELLKVFTTEGGISNAKHRTYAHRSCPYIKVDVDFALSEPKQNVIEERPMDTIIKICSQCSYCSRMLVIPAPPGLRYKVCRGRLARALLSISPQCDNSHCLSSTRI